MHPLTAALSLGMLLTGLGEDPETISYPDPLSGSAATGGPVSGRGRVLLRRVPGVWILRERGSAGAAASRALEISGDGDSLRRDPSWSCVTPCYQSEERARRRFHRDEILVWFREGSDPAARRQFLDRLGGRLLRATRRGDCAALRLEGGLDLPAALERAEAEGCVLFAEPRFLEELRPDRARAPGVPARAPQAPPPAPPADPCHGALDPLFPSQWHIVNPGGVDCFQAGVDLDLLPAWEITCGAQSVAIAVLDSGADLQHPDLRDQFYPRGDEDWNFTLEASKIPEDGFGHGTSVAGLAAAAAGNGEGIAGVAPGARLIPLKVDGIDLVMNVADALTYLADFAGLHPELRIVANGSLTTGNSLAVRRAAQLALAAGIPLFFSSGNDGGAVEFPAAFPESIAVGAIGPDGRRKISESCDGSLWASNHGPELGVVAPGVLLPAPDIHGVGGRVPGDYDLAFSGTSAASPLAAGVAALMLSANPGLTPERVREILFATAADGEGDPAEDAPGFDEFMGWGRVDAGRAVAQALREAPGPRGDADCDGRVSLADVQAILEALFAGQPAPCPQNGDANADGRVNITDPITLVLFLFQGGPPLP